MLAWITGVLTVDLLVAVDAVLAAAVACGGCGVAWLAGRAWSGTRWRRLGIGVLVVCALSVGSQWERGPGREGVDLETMLAAQAGDPAPARLVRVRGEVVGRARWPRTSEDPFAAFAFGTPSLSFDLRVDAWASGRQWLPVRPALLRARWGVDQAASAPPLPGDCVEVLGWAEPLRSAGQPGGFDHRGWLERAGVVGRLRVETWTADPQTASASGQAWPLWVHLKDAAFTLRQRLRLQAERALWLGLDDADPRETALLTRLVLGDGGGTAALRDDAASFRAAGLMHVLSISGAHVGLLLGVGFLALRVSGMGPRAVACGLLVLLGLYLCVVPPRVPVLRAALMAVLVLVPPLWGRRVLGNTVVWLAAWVVLVLDPAEIYRAGFHLSFGVVWAILTFAGPLSRAFAPPPLVPPRDPGWREVVRRRTADVLAVSVVAFAAATLILAAHGGAVTPWAAAASLLAWPLLSLALTLGLVKLLAGLLTPPLGAVLAEPFRWSGVLLRSLAEAVASLPGALLEPGRPVPLTCVAAAVVLALAWRAGLHRGRRVLSLTLLGVWSVATVAAVLIPRAMERGPGMGETELVMFDVGDGSCILLRTPGHVVMFDCGSQTFPDLGGRVVAPALRFLGIDRIDTLVLSHPDLDHINGLAGLIAEVPIGRVLVPPPWLEAAAADPQGPPGLASALLHAAGLRPAPVAAGHTWAEGGLHAMVLWPPAGYQPERSNDGSLAIRWRSGPWSVLLCGDIEEAAIADLLEDQPPEALRADVLELPHHGSVVPPSRQWVEAVRPRLVLQSTWRARLVEDPWPGLLPGVARAVTYPDGMIRVRFPAEPGGPLHVRAWRTGQTRVVP